MTESGNAHAGYGNIKDDGINRCIEFVLTGDLRCARQMKYTRDAGGSYSRELLMRKGLIAGYVYVSEVTVERPESTSFHMYSMCQGNRPFWFFLDPLPLQYV